MRLKSSCNHYKGHQVHLFVLNYAHQGPFENGFVELHFCAEEGNLMSFVVIVFNGHERQHRKTRLAQMIMPIDNWISVLIDFCDIVGGFAKEKLCFPDGGKVVEGAVEEDGDMRARTLNQSWSFPSAKEQRP